MKVFRKEHKKFDYQPRYYKGKGNPFEIKHKFDEYRTTTGKNKNLKAKFVDAVEELKNSEGKETYRTIIIVTVILLLIFLYLIEFDLSIFVSN